VISTPKTNPGDRLDVEIDYSKRGKSKSTRWVFWRLVLELWFCSFFFENLRPKTKKPKAKYSTFDESSDDALASDALQSSLVNLQ
jgi:hypothetical protein